MDVKLLPTLLLPNNLAINILVLVSLCTCREIPKGIYLKAELLGHGVCISSTLQEIAKLLSYDLLILILFSPHTLPKAQEKRNRVLQKDLANLTSSFNCGLKTVTEKFSILVS